MSSKPNTMNEEERREQMDEILEELRIQNSYFRTIVSMKLELLEIKKKVQELEDKINSYNNEKI